MIDIQCTVAVNSIKKQGMIVGFSASGNMAIVAFTDGTLGLYSLENIQHSLYERGPLPPRR